jgi:hypothetical protein
MTREIQDQRLIVGQQNWAHHPAPVECERHLGEEKANRNSRISEIELCGRKHATKQFPNRNKNPFFGLLSGPEMREKRP